MIWVVSNQLSACIQSTLSMYQIDFSLTWIDLYRLDFQFVLKRASSSTPFRLIEVDQILPMDYKLPRPQLRSILPEVNSHTGKLANSSSHLLGSSQVVSPTGQFRPRSIKPYSFAWFLNVVRELKNSFTLLCSYIFRIVVDADICVVRLRGAMCVFLLEVVIFGRMINDRKSSFF